MLRSIVSLRAVRHGRSSRRRVGGAIALLALLLGLALPAVAHHGWSGYHTDLRDLTGVVTEYQYEYPHVHLMLNVDGQPVHIEIVLAPPSRMERRGLAADSIAAGETVTAQGYQHREKATEFRAERIRVRGQVFELR